MIAFPSIVSEDVIAVDDFVKGVVFKPSLLHKVYIKILGLHYVDEVLIACVIVGCSG